MLITGVIILGFTLLAPTLGFLCPSPGSYPNPDDCNSYFVCTEQGSVEMECPLGTAFDPDLKICRYIDDVACFEASTTTTRRPTQGPSSTSTTHRVPSTTSTRRPTTESEAPPSESSTNRVPSTTTPHSPEGPITCPSSGLQPYPNPIDCSTFYLCQNGSLVIITCPIGYQFDTIDARCELIGSAKCDGQVTSSSVRPHSTEKPNYDCGEHLNGMTFPDPSDCTRYFQCSNGNIVGNHCAPGLEFNSELHVCDKPINANCKVTSIFFYM